MVKIFFSHTCEDQETAIFIDWLSRKIERDITQLEFFDACKDVEKWSAATDINRELDSCHVFIPVITEKYSLSVNCKTELKNARKRKQESGIYPSINPVILIENIALIDSLGFKLDQEKELGERCEIFSKREEWEDKYQIIRGNINNFCIDKGLLGDDDFFKDVQHLDLIIKREKPTAAEIKMAIDLCHRKPEYSGYFFKRIEKIHWFYFLRPYRLFNENPKPIEVPPKSGSFTIPYWPILDYLLKVSEECSKPENKKAAEEIMKVIREVTRPNGGEPSDNFYTWWTFIKIISNFPIDVIHLKDIELVAIWLDGKFKSGLVEHEIGKNLLPTLLENSDAESVEKILKLIEIITEIKWQEKTYGEIKDRVPRLKLGSDYEREVLVGNAARMGRVCGKDLILLMEKRLLSLYDDEYADRHSYIWRPAIESHAQNVGGHDLKDVFIESLREMVLAYCLVNVPEVEKIMERYLTGSSFLLKRLGIFITTENYENFGHIIFKNFNKSLFDGELRHEMYMFLNKSFEKFSDKEKEIIINAVEELNANWAEESKRDLYANIDKLRWFHAIRGKGSISADNLYEKYFKLIGSEPEHPEFPSYSNGGYWGEIEPCTVDDLLKMNVKEIAKYLENFKGNDGFKQPSEEGLAGVLEKAIKVKPDKFYNSLSEFLNTKAIYQNRIFQAFKQLWTEKVNLDWKKILEYSKTLIGTEKYFKPENKNSNFSTIWVTSIISDLIASGVQNDEWAMPVEDLDLAGNILLSILGKIESTVEKDKGDYFSKSLGAPKGRCIQALINLVLRETRLKLKSNPDQKMEPWKKFKNAFDSELNKCLDGNFEFSAMVGHHLDNFHFLDKKWVEENINSIFPLRFPANWQAAFEGYTYLPVYVELYELLKINGHLARALEGDLRGDRFQRKVLEMISIGFLNGLEQIEDTQSLFFKLLKQWNVGVVSEIVIFLGSLKNSDLTVEHRNKILELWRYCFEKINGNPEGEILSHLLSLSVFIEEITDESRSWLMQAAPYANVGHRSGPFIEYLDQLAETNPKEVGDVYLSMLSKSTPGYPEENIRSIVEKLYKAQLKVQANEICKIYAKNGQEKLLRDIHDQHE